MVSHPCPRLTRPGCGFLLVSGNKTGHHQQLCHMILYIGRFVANVVVHCMGATLDSDGGPSPTPHEARESAAAQMIAKMRARRASD